MLYPTRRCYFPPYGQEKPSSAAMSRALNWNISWSRRPQLVEAQLTCSSSSWDRRNLCITMEAAGIKENKCTGLYSLWAIQKPKSGIQILDGGGNGGFIGQQLNQRAESTKLALLIISYSQQSFFFHLGPSLRNVPLAKICLFKPAAHVCLLWGHYYQERPSLLQSKQ